jgi:hypothetical protein
MTLRATAVELGAVFGDIVLGTAANELLEIPFGQLAELDALAPGTEAHAPDDLVIELELAIGGGAFGIDEAPRTHHPAADVEAHRTHRHGAPGARAPVGEDHASDGDAVSVMHVGRDRDETRAREARGVDDLAIERGLGPGEQGLRQEEAHVDAAGVGGLEPKEAFFRPRGAGLPVALVNEWTRLGHGITTLDVDG